MSYPSESNPPQQETIGDMFGGAPSSSCNLSLDWVKGKSKPETMVFPCFSYEIWGFPANFPLNQSNESYHHQKPRFRSSSSPLTANRHHLARFFFCAGGASMAWNIKSPWWIGSTTARAWQRRLLRLTKGWLTGIDWAPYVTTMDWPMDHVLT